MDRRIPEDRQHDVTRGMATGRHRIPLPIRNAIPRNASHVFEPIAQVIARPSATSRSVRCSESRTRPEPGLSTTRCCSISTNISGYDRIEGGTRANVGVPLHHATRHSGGYAQAVFGQSYRIAGENDFTEDSGLGTDTSDYVAGVYIQPLRYFGFVAQARFDEDDFSVRRTDLSATASYGAARGSVFYANLNAQPTLGIPTDREEVQGSGSLRLVENWYLVGKMRYDIEGSQRISDSLGIKYADDCFALTVTYEETFIRDRDIEPNESVMVRFEFKHLGAFDLRTGIDSES